MANKADAEGSTQTDNRTGKARATAWSRDRADKEAAYFVAKYVDDPRPFQADKLFCYITGVELDTSPAMRTDGSGRLDRTTFHHDNDSRPSLDTIYPFYMLPDGTVVSVSNYSSTVRLHSTDHDFVSVDTAHSSLGGLNFSSLQSLSRESPTLPDCNTNRFSGCRRPVSVEESDGGHGVAHEALPGAEPRLPAALPLGKPSGIGPQEV